MTLHCFLDDYLDTFRELDKAVHSIVEAPPAQAQQEVEVLSTSSSEEEAEVIENGLDEINSPVIGKGTNMILLF